MLMRRYLFGAMACVGAGLGACGPKEAARSPVEVCESEAKGECCGDDGCGASELCDFDYVCSPAPGGGVDCGDPSGDRMCHSACDESQDGVACRGGGTCTMFSRAMGGDNLMDVWFCV